MSEQSDEREEVRQAPPAMDGRWLAILAVGAIAASLACIGLAWLFERLFLQRHEHESMEIAAPPPPEALGIEYWNIRDTARGLAKEAAQRERLESYGWTDREAGVASIPIDTAIEVWLERQARRDGDREGG